MRLVFGQGFSIQRVPGLGWRKHEFVHVGGGEPNTAQDFRGLIAFLLIYFVSVCEIEGECFAPGVGKLSFQNLFDLFDS